jgi:hypothetical protein
MDDINELHAPAAILPEKKALYLLYRRLGGLHSASGHLGKETERAPVGNRTCIFQSITGSYTDWTI